MVAQDLSEEQQSLDEIVADLSDPEWQLPTPSPRWAVGDQIAHLTYFDESAVRAILDPTAFQDDIERLWSVAAGGDEAVDNLTLGEFREMAPSSLLDRWRTGRRKLAEAASRLDDDQRVSWYGPSMGSKSFLTARLMETWAHGQDVVDTVGAIRPPSDRLRHIARLGFITRDWSYTNRGMTAPPEQVQMALAAPFGEIWTFGRPEATEVINGSALDFCLVVTQRRHLDDTRLESTPLAREWLLIAQAFAGPPTGGPPAGTRP